MKKRFFNTMLLLSVVFILGSCGDSKSTENADNKKTEDNVASNEDIPEEDVYEGEYEQENSVEDVYTKLDLTKDEREKLNTFFSNFSEVQMEPFNEQTISDAEIIHFAVYHNHINNYKRFESIGDNLIKIKKDYIDESAEKYLGTKVSTHQSTGEIEYADGYYTIEDANGEAFYFSQIEDLFEVEDGFYFAIVDVYVASSGWAGDYQSSPDTWTGDEAPEYLQKMTAYITKTKNNSYIINEYMNFKNYQTF